MNLETVNERKESVNDATDATSKLFAAIPTDRGLPIEDKEEDDAEEDENQDDSSTSDENEDDSKRITKTPKLEGVVDDSEESEEDEDSSSDEEGETSEIVTELFTDFGEVELEGTDFENENEAIKAYVGSLAKREHSKGKEEGVTELFEVFPEAKQLVEHLNNGYTLESFMKEVDRPDYSKVNLEESSDEEKERLFRVYLKELGNDDDDIDDAVEIAKDSGKLDYKAGKAQKYLNNKYQKEIEEKKAREKEQAEANKKAVEEQNKQVSEILNSGNLEVANLDKNQSKELSSFLADGKKRNETWKSLSLQKQLLVEYLVATDFKDLNFAKKEAQAKVAQAIRIKNSKSKKSGIGAGGSPRVDLKNFISGKK